MLSLKTILLVSFSCIAQLAAAHPMNNGGLEPRQSICSPNGHTDGDLTNPNSLCTLCNGGCTRVQGQPACC
ncbi:hypothetical protein PspLS_10598 [Pyricularia sp. CBS 133598]|nr:hypothetical protein PspLS_10598 [Pyricularia sp. CBS 133598]